MTDHEQPAAGVALKPKFGDMVENGWASDENPTRRGFFVREFRRTGRMNAGLTWEITDGNGKFWEFKPSDIAEEGRLTVTPSRAPTYAGGAVSEAATRLRDRVSRWTDQDYLGDDRLEVDDALELADDISAVLAALTPAPQAEGEAHERNLSASNAELLEQALSHPPLSSPQPLQQGGEATRAAVKSALQGSMGWPHDLHPGPAADAILALFASLTADRDKAVGLLRDWANARTVSQAGQAKTATDAFLSSQTEES